MSHSSLALFVTALVTTTFTGLAAADRTGVYDAIGDSKDAFYDYVAADARHAKGGGLDHRVRTAEKITPANAGVLEVDSDGDGRCEWAIAKFTFGEAAIHCRNGKTKKAEIKRTAPKVMSFRFSPETIGDPRRYYWRFTNDGGTGTGDSVPSTGWILHQLR